MPFQRGNREQLKGDHQTGRRFRQQLIAALNEADGNATKLRRVAEALIAKAIEGDLPAIREVMDRVDGRVPQSIAAVIDAAASTAPVVDMSFLHTEERVLMKQLLERRLGAEGSVG